MTVLFDAEEQLRRAAAIGDVGIVQKLFSDHPTLDVNATDDVQGQTALQIACEVGYPTLVEHLIAKGADLSHIDKDGLSAVHHACDSKDSTASLKIVQALFDEDPDSINKPSLNRSGDTCLHIAARRCNTALIRWLLDAGVDTAVENATWRTAWDCSQQEVYDRAFYSTPAEMQRSLDSYSAFIEKEVTSGNATETVFDISMRTVKSLELYRLTVVHTLDMFILLEHLTKRNVFQQSCQQIRRELSRSVDGALKQRYREPSCVFETHSDQWLASSDPTDVANERTYCGLEEIPPWRPAPVQISPPASVHRSPTLQPQTDLQKLRDTKTGSSTPNYLSIVMPLLSLELKQNAEESKIQLEGQLRDLARQLKYCKGRSLNFDNFYIAPTLDEYCYPELPRSALDRRNRDQTLMRGTDTPEVVIVNQAWVWQAQDALIFAPLGYFRAPLSPYTEVLATSYGQVGLFLADELDCDDTDTIIASYERSLVQLAEEVSDYVEETGMESIGIEKEKAFFHEIHDIREELSMIRRVSSQKEEVWREFASNAWPEIWADCVNGRMHSTSDSMDATQQENHRAIMRLIMRPRQRIQYQQRLVAQLDEDAERVERSVTIQLDLKQKHASLQEAHSTAVMSAAVFGFAVITIIFTPLSFVVGLFALPIDRLQDSQIPSRWDSSAGMYSTNYIGTWAATTEIVSVALTLAATWLALEYGLKYPITRKTRDLLSRISNRLVSMRGGLQATVKDARSDSRSKAESEKRWETVHGTERKPSSLRAREEV